MPRKTPESTQHQKQHLFLERTAEILQVTPKECEALFSISRCNCVRVNRLSELPRERILQSLRDEGFDLTPISWCPDAYFLSGASTSISKLGLFRQGYVYAQNASSLVPVLALDPQPCERILDVCAAPGGKATHIAAITQNRCELWVNDAFRERVNKLRRVMRSYGAHYIESTTYPGQYMDKLVHQQFDKILLDAYCSGEGEVDLRKPHPLRYWSPKRINEHSRLQRRMLTAAFRLLKPGGTLIYSTCTLAPEENEAVVDHLLRRYPARIEPIDTPLENRRPGLVSWQDREFHPDLVHALRIFPDETMEGFFMCKLRKP